MNDEQYAFMMTVMQVARSQRVMYLSGDSQCSKIHRRSLIARGRNLEPIWDLFGIRLVLARMITRFLPTQLKEGISIKLAITALLLALVFGPALAWIDDHKPNTLSPAGR